MDHNHPYLSATVQLLDTKLYLRHKTILLLTVLFCYLQYFPLAPVLLSTAKKIFLLMILLYFIWLEYETCYNPCFISNSVLQHYLQKVPMLWRSPLVLVSFLPPCREMSVATSAPCTAGSYRPGFLFVLSLLITFEFPQYSISRLTHPLFCFLYILCCLLYRNPHLGTPQHHYLAVTPSGRSGNLNSYRVPLLLMPVSVQSQVSGMSNGRLRFHSPPSPAPLETTTPF